MDDQQGDSWLEKNKLTLIVLGSFFVLAALVVMVFLIINQLGQAKKTPLPSAPIATSTPPISETPPATTTPGLPSSGQAGQGGNAASSTTSAVEAQKIFFGDNYQAPAAIAGLKPPVYNLPLNVKTDVANYYDVNRKINLDAALNDLNQNGFAILDNNFSASADNFYNSYDELTAQAVPSLVTGDFLVYYYQNILKQAYEDIKSSVFYDNLWETNKRLYQAAKQRYENNLAKQDTISDTALEGSRLEVAYFATALSLLAPTEAQITGASGLSESVGFSPTEAERFSFQLPAYLTNDVGQEINLIKSAKGPSKSPVLLYNRDYKIFAVPAAYKNSARLNNFFLASVWLNSVFPLYYQDAACPNCLLDINDWRINMDAAFLIAEDFSVDQDLQNRWAEIYKIQSFFSGLRGDLNYLHYQDAWNSVFGANKKIDNDLGKTRDEIDRNLLRLRDKLAAVDFPAIEGGLSKTATTTRPILGMKVLDEAYSPDNYIFSQLTYPHVGVFSGTAAQAKQVSTVCQLAKLNGYYRCSGSAVDIANLVYPLDRTLSPAWADNSFYQDYGQQADLLRQQFKELTTSALHNHIYWTTLDLAGKILSAPEKKQVVFMAKLDWQKKDLAAAIAAWVNSELPADTFAPHESGATRLNQTAPDNPYASYQYIEPDLTLTAELLADTKMIVATLAQLKVSDGQNSVLSDLKSLQKNLENTETIIQKELQSQDLSEDDYTFINNLIREFSVKSPGNKILRLPIVGGSGLAENISGVKLLILAYQRADKKLFVVGPIFNYREEKK